MVASSLSKGVTEAAPHASMILVQASSATYVVLCKLTLSQGISSPVFLVYQFMLATIFMGALAFIFERNNRPPLNKTILFWIFLLSFLGITLSMNLLAASLSYISSTVESAVLNMIPVFTFILSIISRQEKLGIKTLWGQGKIFGTLLSVSGALTLVLCNGSPVSLLTTALLDWVLGLAMVVFGVLALSTWILLLRPMTSKYPAEISLNAIMFFFATLQGLVVAVVATPEPSNWHLKWDLELLNVFFGAVFYSGLSNFFVTWNATLKGPIFVASFSPLGLVITTTLETLFLGHTLHFGSIVGAVVIALGLYIYLWSSANEEVHSNSVEGDDEYYSAINTSLIQDCATP